MHYLINRETQKLELHFTKQEYTALDAAQKPDIKSNFLFSRAGSCWVSRAKWPRTSCAERVAQSLGAENRGKVGEALSFAEQLERQADRAEARAERYDNYAANAEQRGEKLQAPINSMHGDIAFFTQPNINTSSGRAFTNRRNKMFAAYDRGFEEFRKAGYFADRAATARVTAEQSQLKDKGFCQRRIDECNKTIKAQRKNLDTYLSRLERLNNGEQLRKYSGEYLTVAEVEECIENTEEIITAEIDKACFYQSCIDKLGGIQFSKANIKPGYVVHIARRGNVKVISTGPKNIRFETSHGFPLEASYAEIDSIVTAEETAPEQHPFKVGEILHFNVWNETERKYDKNVPFEITKATAKNITMKNSVTGESVRRSPKLRFCNGAPNNQAWAVYLDDYQGAYKYA